MKAALRYYEEKLVGSGLAQKGGCLLGWRDAEIVWNRNDPLRKLLGKIFSRLNVNALIFAVPAEPYMRIIKALADLNHDTIFPQDTETRTFLHDLPVVHDLAPEVILPPLQSRKGVIVAGHGLLTIGTVNLEQAYVNMASMGFACFVKYFADHLTAARLKKLGQKQIDIHHQICHTLDPPIDATNPLMVGPFDQPETIMKAMAEAGKQVVTHRLVDSFFGNLSYRHGKILYISQTGSSLDQLEDCIDPCPMDGSSCISITASSELPAHLEIVRQGRNRAVVHGHPKFAVILSMDCDITDCPTPDACHRNCAQQRNVCGIPVVSGEVGTGPYGLCHTVPPALVKNLGVIVYGHGLFTVGKTDFNTPIKNLIQIENRCRETYFQRLAHLLDQT